MFDPTSRYFAIAETWWDAPDGRRHVYKRRRFAPTGGIGVRAVATVRDGDRLDTIAALTIGDPLQFWRIADANLAMNPFDLATAGNRLDIPVIGFEPRQRS